MPPTTETKEINTEEIINKAIQVLVDIMEDTNQPAKLRAESAYRLLAVLAKNKRFEERQKNPQHLSLDLGDFGTKMAESIYGLRFGKEEDN